jgi:inner membrane protein
MSPATHLLASWIVAAKTTDNPRDCRLVTLAGVLPDVDGLGLIADLFNSAVRHKETDYYQRYHHYWTHGILGAVVITAVLVCFARRRARVAVLCLVTYHLHLLCDLAGSRGPDRDDKWPIFYFAPLSQHPMWIWKYQWPLFGWQNGVISLALFGWALAIAIRRGDSFLGVFNRRADAVFVGMLRKWAGALGWYHPPSGS